MVWRSESGGDTNESLRYSGIYNVFHFYIWWTLIICLINLSHRNVGCAFTFIKYLVNMLLFFLIFQTKTSCIKFVNSLRGGGNELKKTIVIFVFVFDLLKPYVKVFDSHN